MTEELGVLKNPKRAYYIGTTREGYPLYSVDIEEAYHCTRKEAEQFPQFKFVPLKELK